MSDLNFDITVDSLSEPIAPPAEVEKATEPFKERTPSMWNIVLQTDGSIVAEAMGSKERFEGSIAEFNERLR